METSERTPWRVADLDAALDAIHAAREDALAQLIGGQQAQRLALLADDEATCWEQVFERARTRTQWRAALAARDRAQQLARAYRRRARQLAPDVDSTRAFTAPPGAAVPT